MIINYSSFINNSASTWGGAIYWMGSEGLLINTSFSKNSAINGGAIFWRGDNGTPFNCVFEDNIALENGIKGLEPDFSGGKRSKLTPEFNAVSLRFISFYHPLFFKIHIKYHYFV